MAKRINTTSRPKTIKTDVKRSARMPELGRMPLEESATALRFWNQLWTTPTIPVSHTEFA
jgi:hypothetical protein